MVLHGLAAEAPWGVSEHSLGTVGLVQNYYSVWGTKFLGEKIQTQIVTLDITS